MTTDPLVAALKSALPDAIRARDTEAVSAIRTALAAVANAEAVGGGAAASGPVATTGSQHVAGAAVGVGAAEADRRELTPAEVRAIVGVEVLERSDAAAEHEAAGQGDYADRLRREAAVLQRILDAVDA